MNLNITLFGSAFNPPHLGHQLVITEYLEHFPNQQVWLMPSAVGSFGKTLAPAHQRLSMTNLLHQAFPQSLQSRIHLFPIELDLKLNSGQTWDTFQAIQSHPDYLSTTMHSDPASLSRYSFLIGSDQLTNFSRWGHHQQLLEQLNFIVYPRTNYPLEPLLPGMTAFTHPNQTITNISSSLIRNKLKSNLDISTLVPDTIVSYIIKHHLYQ